jgi:hypothetical protein
MCEKLLAAIWSVPIAAVTEGLNELTPNISISEGPVAKVGVTGLLCELAPLYEYEV